jgi:NADH:ubiquinone oxidoreductase subunit 2 (subunit N)
MIDNISWLAIYPEITLLVMACVIALVDLGVKSARRTGTYVLTMLTLLVVAVMQGMYAAAATPSTAGATWLSRTPWATGSSALPLSP